MTGSRAERSGGELKELLFNTLEIGNQIILGTLSGSRYRLSVQRIDATVQVSVERSGAKASKVDEATSWEKLHLGTLFDLNGSCINAVEIGTDLELEGETPGRFIVGERAWLSTQVDGKDTILLTTAVQTMQVLGASE